MKKHRFARRVAVVFIVIIITCTFVSKSVYNASLTKVMVIRPVASRITHSDTTIGVVEYENTLEVKSDGNWSVQEVLCKEGDFVEAETPLFRIDMDNFYLQRKQLEYQVALLDEQISDLGQGGVLQAPFTGFLSDVAQIKDGDAVNKGMRIGLLQDRSEMHLSLYFSVTYKENLQNGMTMNVSISDMMTLLPGKIIDIDKRRYQIGGEDSVLVKISVPNPGALQAGMNATAIAEVNGESILPIDSGTLIYKREEVMTAPFTGIAISVGLSEGAFVSQGDVLLQIAKEPVKESILLERETLTYRLNILNSQTPADEYIRTPTAGRIEKISAYEGRTVYPEDVLATIIPEKSLPNVVCYLSQERSEHFSEQGYIVITGQGENQSGLRLSINEKAWDVNKQQYKFTAQYHDDDLTLNGASFAVELFQTTVNYRFTVPPSAIREDADGKFIYILDEREGLFGKETIIRKLDVSVEDSNASMVAIENVWLYDETNIVTGASTFLFEGDVVFIVEQLIN